MKIDSLNLEKEAGFNFNKCFSFHQFGFNTATIIDEVNYEFNLIKHLKHFKIAKNRIQTLVIWFVWVIIEEISENLSLFLKLEKMLLIFWHWFDMILRSQNSNTRILRKIYACGDYSQMKMEYFMRKELYIWTSLPVLNYLLQ